MPQALVDQFGRSVLSDTVAEPVKETAIDVEMGAAPGGSPLGAHPISLYFHDVQYEVTLPGGGKKQILHDISGMVKPGEMCALMGASGAGKSSMLNVISGLSELQTGEVLFNGAPRASVSKRMLGYVQQAEVLFPHLTPRESLTYTARLKLPRSWSRAQKDERVETVMDLLGLNKCADTKIGHGIVFGGGLSGGERKRVSIATELLTNPSLLLLDEPTSGLDSFTALALMKTLLDLVRNDKRTVMATIHQPSSQLFELFDKLILLADGRIVYSGPAMGVVDYMAGLGYPCAVHYNPADFIIDLVNGDAAVSERLIEEYRKQPVVVARPEPDRKLIEEAKQESKYAVGWVEQFSALAERSAKQHVGDTITWLNFWQLFLISIVAGFVWWQIPFNEKHIQERLSVLFFAGTLLSFLSTAPVILLFPLERSVLQRERFAGTYHISAYYLAKIFSQVLINLLYPMICAVVVYWMAGLRNDAEIFFTYFGTMMLSCICAQSFGVAIATATLDVAKGVTSMIVILVSFMLVGGFFVPKDSMPEFLAEIGNISFMRWTYEVLLKNEMGGATFNCNEDFEGVRFGGGTCPVPGESVVAATGLDEDRDLWEGILVVSGMILAYYTMGYFFLRYLHRA